MGQFRCLYCMRRWSYPRGSSWWDSVSVLPLGRALHGVGFVPHYNGAFGRFCYLFLLVSGAKYWTRCPRALFSPLFYRLRDQRKTSSNSSLHFNGRGGIASPRFGIYVSAVYS